VQDGIFLIQPNLADSIFGQNRAKLAQAFDPTTFYGNTYDVTEDISAGYGLVRFGAETWRAVAGLRYESTGLSSNGYLQTNGAWNKKTNTSETGYALPSLNASADTGNFLPVLGDGQVRFAYGRTLGRPRFDAIATHGGVLNTTTSPFTLTQGNASLRPLTADNFDVSHEWYADNGRGLFAIGLFYKQIHDAIFNYGQTESQTINGVTVPVLVSQYRNATDLTRVQGLEVSFTRDFTFLPAPFDGLGISGNATFMQTHAPVHLGDGSVVIMNRLPQQANNILNLSLYYESDRFHGRIAWNHTGTEWDDRFSFLGSAAAFYQNRYVRPLDYLDISIAYDIAPQFTVSASVINATGTDVLYGFGRSQEAIHDVIGFAPSVLLGISCKF
jgi:TonB-dependent receptor